MTTATDTADARAFLDAIAAEPADDTARLVYADWLDEHGDPDRAEFIRVQCESERHEPCIRCEEAQKRHTGGGKGICHGKAGLLIVQSQLRTANEAAWRRGPRCRACSGGYVPTDRDDSECKACDGGDLGGLMREWSLDERHDAGLLVGAERLKHPVAFARGFPDEVRCELGEVVERKRRKCPLCKDEELTQHGYCCRCDSLRGEADEDRVTDWARRVVAHHPVRGFRVTDREPDNEAWWSHKSGTFDSGIPWQLPWLVFDALRGGEKHSPSEKHADRGSDHHNCIYPTPEAAHDALACALALLARKANTGVAA